MPFLYQPPFFLWLLGLWLKLWGSDSYLTGRLFSVLCSVGMLGLLYAFVRMHIGKGVALLTLLFVGSDVWMIFTNQGILLVEVTDDFYHPRDVGLLVCNKGR